PFFRFHLILIPRLSFAACVKILYDLICICIARTYVFHTCFIYNIMFFVIILKYNQFVYNTLTCSVSV
ncbi:hypothetical protein L9F63_002353, partial [Diploptera punctata]